MRYWVFAKRNIKEILRDPLSYVFCLGFPIFMLLIFQVINSAMESALPLFSLDRLTPGIAVFSFSFVMLYVTLLVSKDRASSFLQRLYTSPMTTLDFILGYTLPALIIAFAQAVICFAASWILAAATGVSLSLPGTLLAIVSLLPVALLFIGFGLFFGSMFSEKAAPGMSSIVISVAGMLSGAWMPIETMGKFETFSKALPFYPAVSYGRVIFSMNAPTFSNVWGYLLIVCAYALVIYALSVFVFSKRMSSDNA